MDSAIIGALVGGVIGIVGTIAGPIVTSLIRKIGKLSIFVKKMPPLEGADDPRLIMLSICFQNTKNSSIYIRDFCLYQKDGESLNKSIQITDSNYKKEGHLEKESVYGFDTFYCQAIPPRSIVNIHAFFFLSDLENGINSNKPIFLGYYDGRNQFHLFSLPNQIDFSYFELGNELKKIEKFNIH